MSNPYTDYKKAFPPSGGGDLFVKFAPETTTKLRILSMPYYNLSEYKDADTGESTFSDQYSWVVWNYEQNKAQIMSKGRSIYGQIEELAEDTDWGDPTGYDIKITRTGQMLETRYSVVPGKPSELTQEQKDAIATVDIPTAVKGAISIEQRVQEQDNTAGKVFN